MLKKLFPLHIVSLFPLLCAILLSGCGVHTLNAQPPGKMPQGEEGLARPNGADRQIPSWISGMTLEEKVAQLFFVAPEDIITETKIKAVTQTGDIMKTALDNYPVGGLIFFKNNLTGSQQTKSMLKNMQEHALKRRDIPLFLGVDEEGGTIARIANNPAFNMKKVSSMGKLARNKNLPEATKAVSGAASIIGTYLKELGFNVDFAPVADVITTEKASQIIGDRAFGRDPQSVKELARAYAEGLRPHGILSCYKHFPGHGSVTGDSHKDRVSTSRKLRELWKTEFVPFADAEKSGIDFIMVGHIWLPNVTKEEAPASLSEEMIQILRNELGYKGIIITDAFNMGAIAKHFPSGEAAVKAIEAGCAMVLMPEKFQPAYEAVLRAARSGRLPEERINESLRRIFEAKLKLSAKRPVLR
ncbi:MAG: glycoside hydrolase family 3 protein [bacterium]|nr:glycoside hydrolase family 3 protein [bacterium]